MNVASESKKKWKMGGIRRMPWTLAGVALLSALSVRSISLKWFYTTRKASRTSEVSDAVTTTDTAEQCPLPPNARWCDVRLVNGVSFPMAVYASSDIVSNSICQVGYWEVSDFSVFAPQSRKTSSSTRVTALDIGANIGYYSLSLIASGMFDQVIAFEPMESNLQLLKASLCRSPELAQKIKLHPVALGKRDETCQLYSDPTNVGDGVLHCGTDSFQGIPGIPGGAGYVKRGSAFQVKTLDELLTADALLPPQGLAAGEHERSQSLASPASSAPGQHVAFVKMDVEGHECEVLQGGTKLLSQVHPDKVETEVWPKMSTPECQAAQYLHMYEDADYQLAREPLCASPDTAAAFAAGTTQISNYYACSSSGPAKHGSRSTLGLLEEDDTKMLSHSHVVRLLFSRRGL
ncbi:unnamed protein product [Amoebophrya sp. A120]|nr:unnamed protein product [Amoebophrya sp. A120]|eukprot:GSA120T00017345001.1